MGPFAKKISTSLKEIVLTLARLGHYIIIDDVAFGKKQIDEWRNILKDYKVLWIGIKVPLEILEEREKERGNRIVGSARAQYYQVHQDAVYDLEFDTHLLQLADIIKAIKEKLLQKPQK